MQGILQKLLLVLVVLGAVNIVLLLIIKSKAKKSKENQNVKNKNQIDEKSSIKVLNYEDEDLICMVENNLELDYGYECTDENTFENMNKYHRNIYSLLWFDKEIINGGLGEYFFGYSNITMKYIEEALNDIGDYETLSKYKEVLLNNDVENAITSISKRNVEEYTQFMSQFDFVKFNDYYNHKNIDNMIAKYIRKNICEFSTLTEEDLNIWNEISREY